MINIFSSNAVSKPKYFDIISEQLATIAFIEGSIFQMQQSLFDFDSCHRLHICVCVFLLVLSPPKEVRHIMCPEKGSYNVQSQIYSLLLV